MLFGTEYTAEKAFDHLDEDENGKVDFFLNIEHVFKVVNVGF